MEQAGVDEDIEVITCPRHLKASRKYCITCKNLICKECTICKDEHELCTVQSFLYNFKGHIPPKGCLPMTVSKANLEMDKCTSEITKATTETKKLFEKSLRYKTQLEGCEEGKEYDMRLIGKIMAEVKYAQVHAYSYTLEQRCKTVTELLDISKVIDEEIKGYHKCYKELQKEVRRMVDSLNELHLFKNRLKAINEIDLKSELNELQTISLLVLIEKGILERPKDTCIGCEVENFVSFKGANLLPGMDEAMRQKEFDVGRGVKVTEPVPFPLITTSGEYIRSSLSHDGIFVSQSYCDKTLEFIDLKNGGKCKMEIDGGTLVGFYDDKAIFLTYREPLRECYVRNIFESKGKLMLKRIGEVDQVSNMADVSLLNVRRELYYVSTQMDAYKYNVDDGKNVRILNDMKVISFASLGGVDIGFKALFKEHGNGYYTFNIDDSSVVNLVFGYSSGLYLTNIIPSSSDPRDVRKAMKLFDDSMFYFDDEESTKFSGVIDLDGKQSIVRVYRDIFIVYDGKRRCWVLTRIIIP